MSRLADDIGSAIRLCGLIVDWSEGGSTGQREAQPGQGMVGKTRLQSRGIW